jgi:hypothetical protein
MEDNIVPNGLDTCCPVVVSIQHNLILVNRRYYIIKNSLQSSVLEKKKNCDKKKNVKFYIIARRILQSLARGDTKVAFFVYKKTLTIAS